MRETRTSGSMSGVRRRSDGAERGTDEIAKAFGNSYSPFLWQPRLTPTLPPKEDAMEPYTALLDLLPATGVLFSPDRIDRELVLQFFMVFARAEYALKRSPKFLGRD